MIKPFPSRRHGKTTPAPADRRPRRHDLYEGLRIWGVLAGLAAALCAIVVMHHTLAATAAKILLDRGGLLYPYSVQNMMWLAFGVALSELLIRFATVRAEGAQLVQGLLPEDEETVLTATDLPQIYRDVKSRPNASRCFLPRLIQRCAMQFQASESIEQSGALLNTSLEMQIHEIDLRYSLLRYLSWLIPSLGFIGTVVGIGHALAYAGQPDKFNDPKLLSEVTSRLAVAFDGTLLALILASIIVFFQTLIQSREEKVLNLSGEYCLDNLINRLYTAPSHHGGPDPGWRPHASDAASRSGT